MFLAETTYVRILHKTLKYDCNERILRPGHAHLMLNDPWPFLEAPCPPGTMLATTGAAGGIKLGCI